MTQTDSTFVAYQKGIHWFSEFCFYHLGLHMEERLDKLAKTTESTTAGLKPRTVRDAMEQHCSPPDPGRKGAAVTSPHAYLESARTK
jgi:hypothetical protein